MYYILNAIIFIRNNLQYHEPVFGTDDMKFIDFVAPSFTIG